jgi:solute carrier family 39 (zinc transporter), member 1/2/3
MVQLQPRHSRGLWTLALVGLSESVALVQALEWGSPAPPPWQASTGKKHAPHAKSSQDSSRSDSEVSLWGKIVSPFQMNKASTSQCIAVPRGGAHSHAHSHGHACVDAATSSLATATTPYGIPLPLWKVIFQTFLTAMNVMCWYWPLKSKRISDNRLLLSLANAFSGGVFLSLAMGHLIPECVHGFDPKVWNEATPYWCVLAGYMLIFFVEKVAFDAHDIMHHMQEGDGDGHSHSHAHASAEPTVNGHHSHYHHTSSSPNKDLVKTSSSSVSTSSTASATTGRSCLILLGALGVHSILEMMALGLVDTFRDGALLTASIALHQPAESLALLVAFIKSGMPQAQIVKYLSIFSAMGPIGVALGMAVNEYAAPIVDSILLAVVAGTFVYVGATEVIPEEWETPQHKWKKFAALVSGMAFIYAVTQYTHSLGAHPH